MDTSNGAALQLAKTYRRSMWALLTIIILVSTGWLFFAWYPTPVSGPLFTYTGYAMQSETALCPGETLAYDLGLRYNDAGVFDIDVAVWRVSPPATMVYSASRRAISTGAQEFVLHQAWGVPTEILNPRTGRLEPFAAGEYERRHAVTTVSRATKPAIMSVPFTVLGEEDCGGN